MINTASDNTICKFKFSMLKWPGLQQMPDIDTKTLFTDRLIPGTIRITVRTGNTDVGVKASNYIAETVQGAWTIRSAQLYGKRKYKKGEIALFTILVDDVVANDTVDGVIVIK